LVLVSGIVVLSPVSKCRSADPDGRIDDEAGQPVPGLVVY
jgi:hypothetical protein